MNHSADLALHVLFDATALVRFDANADMAGIDGDAYGELDHAIVALINGSLGEALDLLHEASALGLQPVSGIAEAEERERLCRAAQIARVLVRDAIRTESGAA